jgi:tetratricopeptide (TPR) repeat protein
MWLAGVLLCVSSILYAQAPTQANIFFESGISNLSEKKFAEADADFRKVQSAEPAGTRGIIGMVQVRMAAGRADEAVKLLQQLIAKDPSSPMLHLALGDIAARANQPDIALAQFRQAGSLMNEKSDLYLNGPGGEKDPVAQAVHVLDEKPDGPRGLEGVYRRIAEVSFRKGDAKGALAAQEKMVSLNGSADNLANLGMLQDASGDKPGAAKSYRASLQQNPRNAIVLNNLAFLLAETGGNLDEALQDGLNAETILPSVPELSDTVGWIYLKKGMADAAFGRFADAYSRAPDRPSFREHLAKSMEQRTDKSADAEALRAALNASPGADNQKAILDLLKRMRK